MIKNLVNLANYLDENGLRAEADYLDSLIKASIKKESGFMRDYAKHSALNLGQVLRHLRYLTDLPDTPRVEAMRQRLRWIANDLYYTITPGQWHHTQAELDELSGFTYSDLLRMGFDPDFADKINKKASLNKEEENELNLDDEWLKEVGIDREAEEKSLQEPELEESFEEKIPTAFDNLDWSAQWNMNEHKDSDLKRLKEAGITPVAAEAKTLIGYGSYGRVYNVIWNGKPAVAKVGQKSDGEAWSKILSIRDSLPAQSQKHLGAVHDIIDSPPGSIIVMKKLIPLTSEYKKYWNVGSFKRPVENLNFVNFKELYNSEELMKDLEAELLLWLPEDFRKVELPSFFETKEESNNVKKPYSISDLKKISPSASDLDLFFYFKKGEKDYWAKSLKLSMVKKNKDLINKAKEASKGDYPLETKQTLDTLSGLLEYYAERYVGYLYDNIATSNYITDSFPQNWREDDEDIELHPKLQSFYDMIKQLQGKGIFWSDLKSDNVMLDPYGEELTLVLTDVGNFAMQN